MSKNLTPAKFLPKIVVTALLASVLAGPVSAMAASFESQCAALFDSYIDDHAHRAVNPREANFRSLLESVRPPADIGSFVEKVTAKQKHSVDFSQEENRKPLTEMLMDEKNGIRMMLDKAVTEKFELAKTSDVMETLLAFHGGKDKLGEIFKDVDKGIAELTEAMQADLEGKTLDYTELKASIRKNLKGLKNYIVDDKGEAWDAVILAPIYMIASGQAVAFKMPDGSVALHVGYLPASAGESPAVKSGRSYGATKKRGFDDASDTDLLKAMDKVLKTEEATKVHEVLIRFIATGDASALNRLDLSEEARALVIDVIAVYGAEAGRHAIVNLDRYNHPWETDLAAAQFVSQFVAKSGTMLLQVPGQKNRGKLAYYKNVAPKEYFAVGTDGTGIGVTRKARQKLQAVIEAGIDSLGGNAKQNARDLRRLLNISKGATGGRDIIQTFLENINNPNPSIRRTFNDNIDQIIPKLVKYLEDVASPEGVKAIEGKLVEDFGPAEEKPRVPRPPRRPASVTAIHVIDQRAKSGTFVLVRF